MLSLFSRLDLVVHCQFTMPPFAMVQGKELAVGTEQSLRSLLSFEPPVVNTLPSGFGSTITPVFTLELPPGPGPVVLQVVGSSGLVQRTLSQSSPVPFPRMDCLALRSS